MERVLLLTTQPGWAFATLAELRAVEFSEYVEFHHRDSTIVVEDSSDLDHRALDTPAEVYGRVLATSATGKGDATEQLVRSMRQPVVKRAMLNWLPLVLGTRPRRYSVICETFGRTAVRRQALAQGIDEVVRSALPSWRRSSDQAVRLLCRADPEFAFLGIQIQSNLDRDDSARHGTLRRHLACGLLQLAGVNEGSTVLDPFMGSGAILDAAVRLYGADTAIGLEIDDEAFEIARSRLVGTRSLLFNTSFDELNLELVNDGTKLVTNAPFGVRFEQVATRKLIGFLGRCSEAGAAMAVLISREQGVEAARELGLKRKNVLVMGQPACIVYTPSKPG